MVRSSYIEFNLHALCSHPNPDDVFLGKVEELKAGHFEESKSVRYCLRRETPPYENGMIGVNVIVFDETGWYSDNEKYSLFDIITSEETRILKFKHVGGHPQYIEGYREGRSSYRDLALRAFCENCIATSCGCGHIDRDEKFYLSCDQTEGYIKLLNKFEKE